MFSCLFPVICALFYIPLLNKQAFSLSIAVFPCFRLKTHEADTLLKTAFQLVLDCFLNAFPFDALGFFLGNPGQDGVG